MSIWPFPTPPRSFRRAYGDSYEAQVYAQMRWAIDIGLVTYEECAERACLAAMAMTPDARLADADRIRAALEIRTRA